jgi:Metallo-peptidase family M12/GEVED domain/Secretion system C-terminal sorting domain
MKFFITALPFFVVFSAFAQKQPALLTEHRPTVSYDQVVTDADFFMLDATAVAQWLQTAPNTATMLLPIGNGKFWTLELTENQIFAPDFKVTTSDGRTFGKPVGLYYKGRIVGKEASMVSFCVYRDQIAGIISVDGRTYNLGAIEDGKGNPTKVHVLYSTDNFLYPPHIECRNEDKHNTGIGESVQETNTDKNVGNPVDVYFTADFQTYNDKGSNVTTVVNYVTSIFNQSIILYDSIDITTQISEIFVYTTADPYVGLNSPGSVLDAYALNLAGNFNGDLAHFVSTRGLGGGVAWLGGLCNSTISYAVSASLGSVSNFPTYSWATNVVTHEMGHNLSSPHTHDCSWGPTNDKKIDQCGDDAGYSSGTCDVIGSVAGGGTIMSYCHLTGVGVNFLQHFGALPGARMQNYVLNSPCLATQSFACNNPITLTCGQTYTGTTVGGTDILTTYSCNTASMVGPEILHQLVLTTPKSVTLSLTGTNLILFKLFACGNTNCSNTGTTLNLGTLPAGTYSFIVDGMSNTGSAYSIAVACEAPPACEPDGNTVDEYANIVKIGDYTNTSGNNGGYLNVGNTPLVFAPGQYINVELTPGFTGNSYNEQWAIWIDFNDNGSFSDAGEIIFSTTTASSTTQYGTIVIPATATAANNVLLMRVLMQYSSTPTDPCVISGYGEAEDYQIIINSSQPCPVPTGLGWMTQVSTKGNMYWDDMAGVPSYHLRYKKSTATVWTNKYQTANYRLISALDSNATYEVMIRSICAPGDSSAWSSVVTFNPKSLAGCAKPTSSKAIIENPTTARFVWTPYAGATKYYFRYKPVLGTTFTARQPTIAYQRETILTPGTDYVYQVRSFCSGVWTAYTPYFYFSTPASLPEGLTTGGQENIATVYPNPTNLTFQIAGINADQVYQITLSTADGQALLTQSVTLNESIDIADVPTGLYFVHIKDENGQTKTMTLSKY